MMAPSCPWWPGDWEGYEERVRTIPLDQPVSRRLGAAYKSVPAPNSAARMFLSFLKRQYSGALN